MSTLNNPTSARNAIADALAQYKGAVEAASLGEVTMIVAKNSVPQGTTALAINITTGVVVGTGIVLAGVSASSLVVAALGLMAYNNYCADEGVAMRELAYARLARKIRAKMDERAKEQGVAAVAEVLTMCTPTDVTVE